MSKEYLDKTGLTYFWSKLKAYFSPLSHTHSDATTTDAGFLSASDKTKLDNLARMWYGTCATAAGTAAKVVTTKSGDFTLTAGNMLRVRFGYANTASNPTLTVDGTTATAATYIGSTAMVAYSWSAGEVVDFVYTGSVFLAVNNGLATTTYYGRTKLSSSLTSTSTALAATPSAVRQAYLKANYGTCATDASTAAKVVSCSNFALITGQIIAVRFTYANMVSGITLNVNSTGAKSVSAPNHSPLYWEAYETVTFVYTGSTWLFVSRSNLAITQTIATTGTEVIPKLITAKVLNDTIDTKINSVVYADMTGASSSAAGAHGLVPAPSAGDNEKFLAGDGSWDYPGTDFYEAGTYTSETFFVHGIITSSAKDFYIAVPIFVKKGVTAISISSMVSGLRVSTGGYLAGDNTTDLASYIVSQTLYPKKGYATIRGTNSGGFGTTNNITIDGFVTLTFTLS